MFLFVATNIYICSVLCVVTQMVQIIDYYRLYTDVSVICQSKLAPFDKRFICRIIFLFQNLTLNLTFESLSPVSGIV